MSSSQLPNNKVVDPVLVPFMQDLKTAIDNLVEAAALSQLPKEKPNGRPTASDTFAGFTSVSLAQHPGLGQHPYPCWCGAEHKHSFKSCANRLDPGCEARPTVSPDARLSFCAHPSDPRNFDHNVFCFTLSSTMSLFYSLFLSPRIGAVLLPGHIFSENDPVCKLHVLQQMDLMKIVKLHNTRVGRDGQWSTADRGKYKALARFVTDMRREDIVKEADTMPHRMPWHAERVQATLGWRKKPIEACVRDLAAAMEIAGRHRAEHKSFATCIAGADILFDVSSAYFPVREDADGEDSREEAPMEDEEE